jgi:hypothetical protein
VTFCPALRADGAWSSPIRRADGSLSWARRRAHSIAPQPTRLMRTTIPGRQRALPPGCRIPTTEGSALCRQRVEDNTPSSPMISPRMGLSRAVGKRPHVEQNVRIVWTGGHAFRVSLATGHTQVIGRSSGVLGVTVGEVIDLHVTPIGFRRARPLRGCRRRSAVPRSYENSPSCRRTLVRTSRYGAGGPGPSSTALVANRRGASRADPCPPGRPPSQGHPQAPGQVPAGAARPQRCPVPSDRAEPPWRSPRRVRGRLLTKNLHGREGPCTSVPERLWSLATMRATGICVVSPLGDQSRGQGGVSPVRAGPVLWMGARG